jgi:hypothetical protein
MGLVTVATRSSLSGGRWGRCHAQPVRPARWPGRAAVGASQIGMSSSSGLVLAPASSWACSQASRKVLIGDDALGEDLDRLAPAVGGVPLAPPQAVGEDDLVALGEVLRDPFGETRLEPGTPRFSVVPERTGTDAARFDRAPNSLVRRVMQPSECAQLAVVRDVVGTPSGLGCAACVGRCGGTRASGLRSMGTRWLEPARTDQPWSSIQEPGS